MVRLCLQGKVRKWSISSRVDLGWRKLPMYSRMCCESKVFRLQTEEDALALMGSKEIIGSWSLSFLISLEFLPMLIDGRPTARGSAENSEVLRLKFRVPIGGECKLRSGES